MENCLAARVNCPDLAGERASSQMLVGDTSRYSVYAVHTRFDAVSWFVADAESGEDLPAIVGQFDSFEDAFRYATNLADRFDAESKTFDS